jgi:uncharacterized RDD family membrane protein YckC
MNKDGIQFCIMCGKTTITNFSFRNIDNQANENTQLPLTPPDIRRTIESIKQSLEEIDTTEPKSVSEDMSKLASGMNTGIHIIPKGGFWIRLLAFAIDQIIIYIILLLIFFSGVLAVGLHYSTDKGGYLEQLGEIVTFPYILTLIILTMVYYTYFIGTSGQTIGKLICRLKVVQTNGEPVSYGQAFLRWVGYLVSSIFFYVGYLWIAIDTNRQGWHDKIADTYVVRV